MSAEREPTIYVASRAKFGEMWQQRRADGRNIVSSWIDAPAILGARDYPRLWTHCIDEAASADALILLDDDDESTQGLKGALVETGAALAAGRPVFYCGRLGKYSFEHHPLVQWCASIDDAFACACSYPPPIERAPRR